MKNELYRYSHSDFRYCFSCKSCSTVCPVNIFTAKLHPAQLIRLASFGFEEDLIRSHQIWYCIECGKCSNICPMGVKPHILIKEMQDKAIKEHIVSHEIKDSLFELFQKFHKVRFKVAQMCISGKEIEHSMLKNWDSFEHIDFILKEEQDVFLSDVLSVNNYKGIPMDLSACLTCRECSNACPVCVGDMIFDPLFIFRSVALGLTHEIISLPSIWLCIECETCTKACAQGVKGHTVIKYLKEMAIESKSIDPSFFSRWEYFNSVLFNELLGRIDLLVEKFSL